MPDFHALVPAAGSGSRMGNAIPKQYLPLGGRTMLYHTLAALCACEELTTVFVVLAPEDRYFQEQDWSALGGRLQPLYCGGMSRAESVMNGLYASEVESDDWVLVHDAARPCLAQSDLRKLMAEVHEDEVGGILAIPAADTLKRADKAGRILHTEDRSTLWQAQTPQMFRAGLLMRALQVAPHVTDEASAVEALGLHPRLVESTEANFKVTWPQDLRLAEFVLKGRI